jgi:hypothetical protein
LFYQYKELFGWCTLEISKVSTDFNEVNTDIFNDCLCLHNTITDIRVSTDPNKVTSDLNEVNTDLNEVNSEINELSIGLNEAELASI